MPAEPSPALVSSRALRINPMVAAAIISAAFVIFVFAPHFFSVANLSNLLRQVALTGIIACGMTVVMVGGGFDLSVGGTAALAGVIAIQIAPYSLAGAIGIPILAGGIGGLVNGFVITRFAINPLIVTLGTRYLLYAVANLVTAGFIQINRRPEFVLRGTTPAAIFLALAAVLHVVLKYTTWGARVYGVGSNERAAEFSGIRTHQIRIQTYVLCGACAGLAGVVLAMRSGAATPDAGSGYELDAIAAAVVGGVSMFGGEGGLANTIAGVLLLGFLSNILVLARQPYEMQRIVTGAAIVIAIGLDRYQRKVRQ
jgi:ribose/xylose/arabinose/galactoside ABC-type transport system permease subunit